MYSILNNGKTLNKTLNNDSKMIKLKRCCHLNHNFDNVGESMYSKNTELKDIVNL